MKALYEKNELGFALVSIAAYCFLQSLANGLNSQIGVACSASAVFVWAQALVLWRFVRKNGLMRRYGLCRPRISARQALYYLPLAVLATRNLWNGAAMEQSAADTLACVLCMLGVGFVEELIFRGLLFRAIERESRRAAIVISSVTFGLGHILNLFNGSGMTLWENLLQIAGAMLMGFLFVILFHRGGSLIPCIAAHAGINALSAFSRSAGLTAGRELICDLILFALAAGYLLWLTKALPEPTEQTPYNETRGSS